MKTTLLATIAVIIFFGACSTTKQSSENKQITDTIQSNIASTGTSIKILFSQGKNHNHPSFAIWIENTDSSYIQTLFVTKAVATGIYEHGSTKSGKWAPGSVERPATLPVWAHKAGYLGEGKKLPNTDIPDAYSGATPKSGFVLHSKTNKELQQKAIILVEVNQTWDWNEYWTNNKFPDDEQYKTSCQPSVVYAAEIDFESKGKEISLKPIGHGHYSGKDGILYSDLSTFTTALNIFSEIKVLVE